MGMTYKGRLSPVGVDLEGAVLAIKRDQMSSKFPSDSNSTTHAIPAWKTLCKCVFFFPKYSATLTSFLCLSKPSFEAVLYDSREQLGVSLQQLGE